MGAVTLLPRSRPLTRTDLESVPDDGHRYELIDGALVVTPAPSWRHQDVAFELAVLLRGLCPPDLRVFMAPVDVVLSDSTVMQPDVLVARRADLGARDLPAAPVLAVEVLSPSTKHIDLMLKRSRFEAAGCASYWSSTRTSRRSRPGTWPTEAMSRSGTPAATRDWSWHCRSRSP